MNIAQNFALCASLCLASAMLPGAAFGSNLDFKLDNETSANITSFYVSLDSESDWGDPINNGATGAGDTNDITFQSDASGDSCYYDFKMVFDSGVTAHLYNINLCDATKIEVDDIDNGQAKYTVTYLTDEN